MAMVSYKGENKRCMLRDYLRDDASSCSSSGFRSFPRRQCCVAARSIIEKEVIRHNNRHRHRHRHHTKKKRMVAKNDCSFSYALQRASMAVVNAVKLLPFNSSPVKNNGDSKRFLPRSFSKKLFRRNFFGKKHKNNNKNQKSDDHHRRQCDEDDDKFDDEIERWISSGVVGKEKYQPLDLSNDTTVTNNSTTSVSNSDDKSSDSSWSDISFSSDSSENDDVERTHKMEVSKIDAVIAAQTSAVNNEKNVWLEVEKQYTSPISVLDFTNKDDESFSSSPFTTPRPSRSKGAKERLMKRLGRLEPVNLESLFLSPDIQHHKPQCSIQPCSTPSYILSSDSEDDDDEDDDEQGEEEEEGMSQESEVERQAQHLLNVTKSNNVVTVALPPFNPAFEFELENVLLDYFRQNVAQMESNALLKTAENWLNGHYDNLILGWEVKDKRQAYIRDMEQGGWWPSDTKLEREEIGAKLGDEVLAHLIQELLVDL